MSIGLNLVDSNRKIRADIERAILQELTQDLDKKTKSVQKQLRSVMPSWVAVSPEINGLLAAGQPGSLGSQLGLTPSTASAAVDNIISALSESVNVEVSDKVRKIKDLKITVSIQPSDFQNLLALETSSYLTEQGSKIDWLNWLLFSGTKTIITGYSYEPDSTSGRSGGGYMVLGGVWRIPPQFAGTDNDNFITRIFNNKQKDVQKILEGLF